MSDNPLATWLRDRSRPDEPEEPVAPPAPWDLDDPPPGRRLPRLLALAAVPWLAAAALAVVLLARDSAPPAPTPSPPPPAVVEEDSTAVQERVAELAVRAALSGPLEGGRARYVDHAVAVGAERVGDVVVVGVAALVFEGDPRAWERGSVRHWGVAVRGGVADGPPWPLPVPAPAPAALSAPDPAQEGQVLAALTEAGYRDLEGLRTATDDAVLRAGFTGTAPDGERAAYEVWLSAGPAPRLLGTDR